jgi:hypothetical protein
MKYLLSLAILSLVFVGCDRIEGQLNITKEFKLINNRGVTSTLSVGTYNADITANSKTKFTLRLNNDTNQKYVFNHSGNIPQNGTFKVESSASGQPVNLTGTVSTKITETSVQQKYETCTYQVQVCNQTPNGPVCTMQTHFGNQWTRFFDRQTDQNVTLSVNEVNATEQSADFHGNLSYVDRIILSQTNCM